MESEVLEWESGILESCVVMLFCCSIPINKCQKIISKKIGSNGRKSAKPPPTEDKEDCWFIQRVGCEFVPHD